MGKHTPFGQLKTSDGERQHFKHTSKRQFAAIPYDSTISLPVKEFIQSLLSKTIHVNTLLMFSCHERLVCSCVFVSVKLTGWLSKRKNKWAANLDSFLMHLNVQNMLFNCPKLPMMPKKKPSTTYVLRDTFPPIFRCVVNQNGVLNLVPLLFEWCGLLGQLTRFWNTNISICSACVTFAFLSHLVKWYKAIILNYGFVKVPIKKLQTKDETDL